LEDIRDDALKKDVIERNKIKDVDLLDNLTKYMASTIANLTNPKSIADFLNQNGTSTTNETIDAYLKMLENAFLLYRIPRYELNGKQLLKTQGKYFIVDIGIRNVITGFSNYDGGGTLENIVCMELLRRGYDVYVGKHNDLEVDFVALKPNETVYYQVTKTMQDDKVHEREKRSLLAINDNYPKFIITTDKVKNKDIEGIKVINIIDFLLEDEYEK
jgi:predicted AAA+ superfamily ATPase